jgi:ABC-type amino acid transport system permease subunit
VFLPQAIRIFINVIGKQFIAMQEDSADGICDGVWEITYRQTALAKGFHKILGIVILAAPLDWILTIVSSFIKKV